MSPNQPLLDAIRRAWSAIATNAWGYAELRSDDLALLADAAVQSLTDADDVRRTIGGPT